MKRREEKRKQTGDEREKNEGEQIEERKYEGEIKGEEKR